MKKYEKYKDTTLSWMYSIPARWHLLSLKFVATVKFSSVDRHEFDDEIKVSICHYPDAYKNEKIDKFSKLSSGTCSKMEEESFALKQGQVIITKDSETPDDIGIPTYVTENIPNSVCGYHLAILESKDKAFDTRFLFRYLQSKPVGYYFEINSNGVTRFGLGKPTILNLKVPVPPVSEQTQIASYLDYQTGIIDALISKKEKLVELLKEKRHAIINEAVTKGLNPAAKMKDSGIEWLGEVPEDWKVTRLRFLGRCQNGVSQSGDYFGEGDPFVSYSDVYKNDALPFNVNGLAKSTDSDKENYSVVEGDVFFTRTSETIEEIGLSSTCLKTIDNAVFAGFLIRFRPFSDVLKKEFSRYFFRSLIPRLHFVKEMNLVTRASLSQELLKSLPICLPSLNEQTAIALFLNNQTITLQESIQKINTAIDKLKEYRQSIISEAVTGKVDVRDWQPGNKKMQIAN